MKSSNVRLMSILSALALAGALSMQALAADEHGHDHSKGHDDAAMHDSATALGSVKEAWTLLVAKVNEAQTLIADGKPEATEDVTHDLENVVKTLLEKSEMVAEDKKANLASAVKQLDKAIEALHHGAEDKDAAAASAGLKKINALMPLIKGLYPAGTLE